MIEMDHKEHKINDKVMYACTHYHTLHDLLYSHSLLLRLFRCVSTSAPHGSDGSHGLHGSHGSHGSRAVLKLGTGK